MADTPLRDGGNGIALRTLGWAAFLGASWTWCIGMFLPVLLVRDYGLWAWLIFAAPNVLGAAAMAWVLRDAGASLRTLQKHLPAVVAFSFVTIAFHLFFLLCIVVPLVQSWFALPAALLTMLLAWLVAHQVRGGWLIAASGVLAVSLVIFVMLGMNGALALPAQQGQLSAWALLWLLPVSVFGFVLCPYLDVTFHRARQATSPADGRAAFGIGFGVFFLAMIVLTLLYAPLLISRADVVSGPPAGLAVWLVAIHMAVQAGFTIAAHVRYAGRRMETIGTELTTVLISLSIALLIGAIVVSSRDMTYRGLTGAELAYRFFMAFYGLVFPAYVWVCMIPSRGVEAVPRRAITAFVVAVLVTAPMFWMGFIERRMFWVVPGVAVVLLAQFAVRWTAPGPAQTLTVALPPDAPAPPASPDAAKNFLTYVK